MMSEYLMDSTKLLFYQDRLEKFFKGERIMPVTIDIGIHKSCNIRCAYCYGIKQLPSPDYIPTERLLLLAEDAKKADIKGVAIIGDGEPTMNKGLYPFVRKLKEVGVEAAVGTNGLLLNTEQIKTLTECCTYLRFNISGVDKYDKIMGAPQHSFPRIEQIITSAVKNKGNCTIGLQSVLIPDGFSEIIPLAKKAIEWGVDYLVIKQFADGGEGMPMHFDLDDYQKAVELLKEAQAMSTDKTQIIVKWKAMQDTINITKYGKWDFDRCIDPPFLFQISGNGDCAPCGFLFNNPDYCYGNLITQSLYDILNSDRYWGVINKLASTPVKDVCNQQCRHTAGNKFVTKLKEHYNGNLQEALEAMYGGKDNLKKAINKPIKHRSFV